MSVAFADTEFNAFNGPLISIALVPYDTSLPPFYAVLGCSNPVPWVAEHVMPFLNQPVEDRNSAARRFRDYLVTHNIDRVICDWPEDVAHVARFLITGPGQMLPLDSLAVEFHNFGAYSLLFPSKMPHNALSDAQALRDYAHHIGFVEGSSI